MSALHDPSIAPPSSEVDEGRARQAETVGAIRRALARRIAGELGPERGRTAMLDARLIAAHALRIEPDRLALADTRRPTAEESAAIEALGVRRLAGEPVARIVGEKEFWSLPFRVSPSVLVPRPDTETLVAAVLAAAPRGEPLTILDIGTGSGAILLALLTELPLATGVGTDISTDALRTAAQNAARFGLAERCRFVATNWADGIGGAYRFIVSNPPYIPGGAIAGLEPEVRDHDPRGALDGGPDGFEGHRAVTAAMRRLFAPDGHGFVEIGQGQETRFAALVGRAGFRSRMHFDTAGIARVAEISR